MAIENIKRVEASLGQPNGLVTKKGASIGIQVYGKSQDFLINLIYCRTSCYENQILTQKV
ncbi:hypothetical protein BWI96_03715 [Siphonobacter sp. SORGH_AS_0500]|nr:hypothetical protein BWI96_03715 [Siphonobacter sp. SORGH_AS_0500]